MMFRSLEIDDSSDCWSGFTFILKSLSSNSSVVHSRNERSHGDILGSSSNTDRMNRKPTGPDLRGSLRSDEISAAPMLGTRFLYG